ncbi:MAG: DEAD/DEAH box helicase, partial [Kordiimonadaceae bacterium]|nr:DEAD/DEAH box helicase [Kordiimonadaceae bacterium]
MTKFADLGLRAPILRAVEEGGYQTMTPIQSKAIPKVLEGHDLIAVAQTGTGKTAAFSLPLIQLLLAGEGKRRPKTTRALILAPTRELAVQIEENVRRYSKYLHYKINLVYGGASSKPQIKAMAPGVDILIATPGRLLDLMGQGHIKLGDVEFLILDEADRMLDMGFIRDIRRIVAELPPKRQTLFFSATMPKSVEGLANSILTNPDRVEVAPAATTAEKVDQHILYVPKNMKRKLLAYVLKDENIKRVLIFTRTKHGANRVAKNLDQLGVTSSAIHGNKSQSARQKALNSFKNGEIRALVATDVAARGLDVDRIGLVINYDMPFDSEAYVHRIGRTGRAGRSGEAILFITPRERRFVGNLERAVGQAIEPMDIPSNAEINQSRLDRLRTRLSAEATSEDKPEEETALLQELIQRVAQELEVEPGQLTLAAMRLAVGEGPLLVQGDESWLKAPMRNDRRDDRRGDRGNDRGRRPERASRPPEDDMERFRVEVGHRDRVKPGNLVGAIANESGLE